MSVKMNIFHGDEVYISNMIKNGLVKMVYRNQVLQENKIDLINNIDMYVRELGVSVETIGLMNRENREFIISGTLFNFQKDDSEQKNSFVLGEVYVISNSKDSGRMFAELTNVLKQWAETEQKIITHYGVSSSNITSIISELWNFAGETGETENGEPIIAYKVGK